MRKTPEFEPGGTERIPFSVLYSTASDRFFEAVARSGSPHVKFWQITKSPMIGVTDMPQFYGVIKLVSDKDAFEHGLRTTRIDVHIPLVGADVSAPLPIGEDDPAAHLVVQGFTGNKRYVDPEVVISPSAVRVAAGNKGSVVSMAGRASLYTSYDSNLAQEDDLAGMIPTDITQYDWCINIATRIGFYELVPVVIEPESHLTL